MKKEKYKLFQQLIEVFDEGCDLVEAYDSLLHDYNGVILFQAESQVIKIIGDHEGITGSEIAHMLKKTASACSQLIRKLRKKEWVCQCRNETNNREYNLYLTEEGKKIYSKHRDFEEQCYKRTFESLSDFTEEEMKIYIAIQNYMNKTFQMDVEESQQLEING